MLSTNYSKLQWKSLFLTLGLMMCIVGLPVFAYLQFVFFPLLDNWIIASEIFYDLLDSEYMKNYLESLNYDEITAILISSLVSALGLLTVAMFPVYVISHYFAKVALVFAKRLRICPVMNLVVFWNGKKIDELRFS